MQPNNKYYKLITKLLDESIDNRHHTDLYYTKRIAESYGETYLDLGNVNKYLKDFAEDVGVELDGKHHINRWYLKRIADKLYDDELEYDTENYYLRIISESINPTPPPRLPSEYQEVEYIENTGTSFINTGYSMTSDVVEYNVTFYDKPPVSTSMFGAERNSKYSGVLWTSAFGVTSVYIGTKKEAIAKTLSEDMWYNIIIKTTSATYGSWSVNGSEQAFSYNNGILKDSPVFLFANNIGNVVNNQNCQIKIAYFSITDNGEKVRELIPCYRKSDDVIGMYDLVNDVFYVNSGTGTFSKGADV